MTKVPLFTSDWRRDSAKEAVLKVQNRFFEQNPNNQVDGVAMITRPGYHKYANLSVETGDTVTNSYQFYYQNGLFDNDCFQVGSDSVCRLKSDGTAHKLSVFSDTAFGSSTPTSNQVAFIGGIGSLSELMYVTDGAERLFFYPPLSLDTAILTDSSGVGAIADGAVIRVGEVYYKATSGSVDAGTPGGTSANPWLISLSMNALYAAINATGVAGIDYSTNLTRNPIANAESNVVPLITSYITSIQVYATYTTNDPSASKPVVSVTGDSNLSWSSSTMTGGASESYAMHEIPLPFLANRGGDYYTDFNIQAIESFYSYLIISVESFGKPGRFYWINAGDRFVDPLNFATAESSPDGTVSIRAVGERLFFLGGDSIETWYFTGDGVAPFARVQGGVYNIGVLAGTDLVINDYLVFSSPQGFLYKLEGSSYSVVSSPQFSNRIREFLDADVDHTFRSWSCRVEGHMFYILNLDLTETIVYDVATDQFCTWGNNEDTVLEQSGGCLWGTFYIVGSFSTDAVWRLDPDYQVDDDASVESTADSPIQNTFLSVVTGGVPARMRETVRCNEVYLTASLGYPRPFDLYVLADEPLTRILYDTDGDILIEWDDGSLTEVTNAPYVTLETSDDNGQTWVSRGSIFIVGEDWNQELVWRSLGSIGAPGRLFKISDYSALPRIDGLDIR